MLTGLVNLVATQGFGFGLDAGNIWYNLAYYIGQFIVIYGLLLLRRVNRYFKVALVLRILVTLIGLVTFLHRHLVAAVPTNDTTLTPILIIITHISVIISFVAFFCLYWGMAGVSGESGLPNLSRRFKRLFWLHILAPISLLLLVFVAAAVVPTVMGTPENPTVIVFSFVMILPFVLLGAYELYLTHFTHAQLESEMPRDVKPIFPERKAKLIAPDISALAELRPHKTIARFCPGSAHRSWRVLR